MEAQRLGCCPSGGAGRVPKGPAHRAGHDPDIPFLLRKNTHTFSDPTRAADAPSEITCPPQNLHRTQSSLPTCPRSDSLQPHPAPARGRKKQAWCLVGPALPLHTRDRPGTPTGFQHGRSPAGRALHGHGTPTPSTGREGGPAPTFLQGHDRGSGCKPQHPRPHQLHGSPGPLGASASWSTAPTPEAPLRAWGLAPQRSEWAGTGVYRCLARGRRCVLASPAQLCPWRGPRADPTGLLHRVGQVGEMPFPAGTTGCGGDFGLGLPHRTRAAGWRGKETQDSEGNLCSPGSSPP